MNSMLAIIPVAAGAYVATNMDNFVLLVALLARYRKQTAYVVAGFLACAMIVAFVGLWIGTVANFFPVEYLGLLGLVPISIGVFELIQLLRAKEKKAASERVVVDDSAKVFSTTLGTQLGNATDTVVVFGVLFVDSKPAADFLAIVTFAVMALVFVCVGMYAVRHPAIHEHVDRHAHRIMPFILIAVGIYVLFNTATDIAPN